MTTPLKTSSKVSPNSRWKSENHEKIIVSSINFLFFQDFFLTVRRKPFKEPFQKTSAKSKTILLLKCWNETSFFSQQIYSKFPLDAVKAVLKTPLEIFCTKSQNDKKNFSTKNICPRNVPRDTQKLVLTTVQREFFHSWTEKLLLKVQNCFAYSLNLIKKLEVLQQNSFFFKIFPLAHREPFRQQLQKTPANSKTISCSKWWNYERDFFS